MTRLDDHRPSPLANKMQVTLRRIATFNWSTVETIRLHPVVRNLGHQQVLVL